MSHYETILATYDSIHRSPANRASHAIGIPLIVTSMIAAASYVGVPGDGLWAFANLATVLTAIAVATVLSWSVLAGLAYLALMVACYAAAMALKAQLDGWMAAGVIAAGFVLGWVFQFIGHGFEGKSPEFVQRPENLLLGPVMIMAELIPAIRPQSLRARHRTSLTESAR